MTTRTAPIAVAGIVAVAMIAACAMIVPARARGTDGSPVGRPVVPAVAATPVAAPAPVPVAA